MRAPDGRHRPVPHRRVPLEIAQTMATEKWVPVIGFEGLYEVSDFGRVRALDRIVRGAPGLMQKKASHVMPKFFPSNCPYPCVWLSKDGKGRNYRVHRIVFCSFNGIALRHDGNMKRGIIRHINDVPTDSRLENLAIGTAKDNSMDAIKNRKKSPALPKSRNRKKSFLSLVKGFLFRK